MKVILWSDNHNFPSLPLMKISAYHKAQGDKVSLYDEAIAGLQRCDILYKSNVFSFTEDLAYYPQCDKVIEGGSGYAITVENGKEIYNKSADPSLPPEIESQYPDYDLYPQFKNTAYGFLTRGCPNNCSFCIVSQKEGRCTVQVAELSEFWRGQRNIKLMDGNLLACKDRESLLQQLIDSGANIDYTQGLDARFITDDIARLVCLTKIDMIHFAFDFTENEKAIVRGLEAFKRHFKMDDRKCNVYILTNYDTTHEEDMYRVRRVIELGYHPFVMVYGKYKKGDAPQFLIDLAGWANNPRLYRTCSFPDFVPRTDGKSCRQLYAV